MSKLDDVSEVLYFHLNHSDHFVLSYGYSFPEFYKSVTKPIQNILLLKQSTDEGELHLHTLLQYVTEENMEGFINRGSYKNGSLCWIDFDELSNLDLVEGQELAELLYLGHLKKHLKIPFYQTLNNQYVYLSDEESMFVKTFYKDLMSFYNMVSNLIPFKLRQLKMPKSWFPFRKKPTFPRIDVEVLKTLEKEFKEGIIFSFNQASIKRNKIQIPFWLIGDIASLEELEEEFKDARRNHSKGYLIFDKGIWSIK